MVSQCWNFCLLILLNICNASVSVHWKRSNSQVPPWWNVYSFDSFALLFTHLNKNQLIRMMLFTTIHLRIMRCNPIGCICLLVTMAAPVAWCLLAPHWLAPEGSCKGNREDPWQGMMRRKCVENGVKNSNRSDRSNMIKLTGHATSELWGFVYLFRYMDKRYIIL